MGGTIDSRLLARLTSEFDGELRDRRAELAARYHLPPPRPGGAPAVAAFVVHHTAGSQQGTYEAIWRYHVQALGWSAPGYGIWVAPSGVVELGVLPSRLTYGVWGRHAVTYNLALPGNYNRDIATPEQLHALYLVLCCLDDAYGGDGRIWRGHSEWALRGHATACPGANLLPHVQRMRGRLYGAASPRPRHYP